MKKNLSPIVRAYRYKGQWLGKISRYEYERDNIMFKIAPVWYQAIGLDGSVLIETIIRTDAERALRSQIRTFPVRIHRDAIARE